MNKISVVEFYIELLRSVGIHANADGTLSVDVGEEKHDPWTIKGRRVVLPTKEQMAEPALGKKVFFHPLVENILRGESEVMESFRAHLTGRLTYTLSMTSVSLLMLAASPEEQKKASPDQLEFFTLVKDADEAMFDLFSKVIERQGVNNKPSFLKLFLKRGGSLKGSKYRRVASAGFPLFESIRDNDKNATGASKKLSQKAHQTLVSLLQYVLPGIGDPDQFSIGSDSDVAPSFESLMEIVHVILKQVSTVAHTFKKLVPDLAAFETDLNWYWHLAHIANFTEELRRIPMQAGNEGAGSKVEQAQAQAAQAISEPTRPNAPTAALAAAGIAPANNTVQKQQTQTQNGMLGVGWLEQMNQSPVQRAWMKQGNDVLNQNPDPLAGIPRTAGQLSNNGRPSASDYLRQTGPAGGYNALSSI